MERTLPDDSRIAYEYEGPFLKTVTRLHPNGSTLYTHTYDQYNEAGLPLSETGLFQTTYAYDRTGVRRTSQVNPYFQEELDYDAAHHLIRSGATTYTYDDASQLTSETNRFTARYDQQYNRIEKNGRPQPVDALGQVQGLSYDKNGNLIKSDFVFDAFDQLVYAEGEEFLYDATGRRLQKARTSYLYIDYEEIGSFESGNAKELKILGHQGIVAIEVDHHILAPIQDVQGTIRSLIDWNTKKLVQENFCDAFGCGLTEAIPYAYAGKRYDAKAGLVYFGQRYYDPALSRWLTQDPLGPIDHANLYQYVFNNPFLYRDPYGESIGGYLLGLGEVMLGGAIMVGSLGLELATFGGFTFGFVFVEGAGAALIGHGLSLTAQHAHDISFHSKSACFDSMYKSGSVDPSLPENPDDLLKRPEWKETTHPEAGKKGHRTFENETTGEKLRHDKGKPWETGHKAYDHYHRPNPHATGRHDEYLDGKGNPTRDQSDPSHLYSPEGVWWN